IISLGQAFAIISGGLDLSLASVMSLAGVLGVLVMPEAGPYVGIAVMLLTGAVMGGISGCIIAIFKTSPLVITLGMLSVSQALALILSGGIPLYGIQQGYADAVGFATIASVPVMVWIGVIAALVAGFVLRHTVFGRHVYAIGSSV